MPDDYLDSDETFDTVVADSSTPRVFGILNIIVSLLAMCWGGFTLFTALVLPTMYESMEVAQVAAQEATAEELETLKADIAEASTEEEKAELQAEIDLLETDINGPDINVFTAAMKDETIIRYGIVDGTSGVFLNMLMLISGVGLLFCKEWARKLALWTAGLKIIRLLALQAVNIVVIAPITVKYQQEMFAQMDMGGGPGMTEMAGMQVMMQTAFAVVLMVGGCIYPALSLWFLSRPRVKATCQMIPEEAEAV